MYAMKPFVSGLLVAVLFFGGARYAVCEEQKPEQAASVMLTSEHPVGSFAIDAETLRSAPPMLALRITNVVNPGRMAFQIFVSLTYRSGTGRTEQIPLGNVGLYPADRPASFVLRASNAFAKVKAAGSEVSDVRVQVEMKRRNEAEPWTAVEVTVATPEWKAEAGR
jgi:hypothetical protein